MDQNNSEIQYGLLLASGVLLVVGAGMVVAPKAGTKLFLLYAQARSNYRWKLRLKTPDFLRRIGDSVFKLSKETASLDSPRNINESIKVVSATLDVPSTMRSYEVGDKVNSCLQGLGATGKIVLYMEDFVTHLDKKTEGLDDCSLEVVYIGHADPAKRIPAAEFAVKYRTRVCSSIVFPPYSATENIQRGFKTNKVLHARTFHEKNLTPLAKKYAGLRANFYEDVTDSHVQKRHIDHKEVHVLLAENGKAPQTILVSRK